MIPKEINFDKNFETLWRRYKYYLKNNCSVDSKWLKEKYQCRWIGKIDNREIEWL
ncbi:hypothetical protein HYD61_02945 [Mycoplasmopsis bovis]|nr:hypothetical protein [Mycoplasmopsis bovis]QQH60621.1 hypothetical protein HYD61_02945 [Mycoplasmopsis bovis]